jgi:TPP-dependent pyruvate/acetoin dehydrogenase alpha subunit
MGELDLRTALRSMTLIREFEAESGRLRATGAIACSVHQCTGQEAIAVGAMLALRAGDTVAATYRGHHWAIACGIPIDSLMAEFMGRESGLNGGRAGAGLFLSPEHGFLCESGIVGATGPIATGAALAYRHDGTHRVAVASFGDGAMCFAAAAWLPVIFMCENNGYAEFTESTAMVRVPRLSDRAAAYGFSGIRIDGDDPAEVFAVVGDAADRARDGGGPILIEAMTHRLAGHNSFDLEPYRPRGEKERWREVDCIARLRARLGSTGISDGELEAIQQSAVDTVASAVARAEAAPLANALTVRDHVYA